MILAMMLSTQRDSSGRRQRDDRGYILPAGLYALVRESLKLKFDELVKKGRIRPKKHGSSKVINQRKFENVIRCYMKHVFEDAIENLLGVEWYPGFGKIMVRRVKCSRPLNIPGHHSFWTFIHWLRPPPSQIKIQKRVYSYKLVTTKRWKRKLKEKIFVENKEYLYLSINVRSNKRVYRKTEDLQRVS